MSDVRRDTATFTFRPRVVGFQAPRLLRPADKEMLVLLDQDYQSKLGELPARLGEYIHGLFYVGVVLEARILRDEIYLTLPHRWDSQHLLPEHALGLFAQATAQFLSRAEPPATWDFQTTITYRRGTGGPLGETGAVLARWMDEICAQ